MTLESKRKKPSMATATRLSLGFLLVFLLLLLLVGAASIPFFYESKSMWYRFGVDKTLIRTGKVFGLLAATLLMLQLLLSARLTVLDRIFTFRILNRVHRINGGIIAVCAVLHPLLVFAPEDIANLSPEWRYWPEVTGAGLLLLIWTIYSTAAWRSFLDFSYKKWWILHRIAALAAVVMVTIHVLYVSSAFEAGQPPRLMVFTALAFYAVLWIRVQIKRRWKR